MTEAILGNSNIERRAYQERVIANCVESLDSSYKSAMIESPTGSGKTIMGLLIAKYFQEKYGWKTGWVSMRRNILNQIGQENEAKIGLKDLYPISMFDKDPPMVDLLIVDEGHHDSTNSCMHLHNYIRPKKILGLTATPFRTDRMKLCFEKVIKDAGIRALVDQGYLSPFHHFTTNRYTPESVAELYLSDRKKWGKSLMFFLSIAECHETAEILAKSGVKVDVVTGQTDRYSQLDAFDKGKLDVIINVFVLTEGFDCPDLRSVFVRPSSKSPTIQMAGRVLRKHDSLPWVNVIQSEDTKYPFTRLASAQRQFVKIGDEWRSLKADSKRIQTTACRALMAIATTEVRLPELLIKLQQQRRRRNFWGPGSELE